MPTLLTSSRLLERPDLLNARSPEGLEIYQITHDPLVPACHISMEAQVFTPDSAYFVLHRGVGVQSYDHKDPRHQLLLCETATGEIREVSEERGVVAPSVAPDGRFLYYFVDETVPGGGKLTLKRRHLQTDQIEILEVLDKNIPGTKFRFSRPGQLSTIRSDGKSLGLYGFLGNGVHEGGSFGLLIFDLVHGGYDLVFHGRSWWNMHIQYCRSTDDEGKHDILIQENHNYFVDPNGKVTNPGGGMGADVHVIRDDGQNFRNMPWGRTKTEFCAGHQCWRGQTRYAIGSVLWGDALSRKEKRSELRLMESLPIPHFAHNGAAGENSIRNDLSRNFPDPHFNHFATDQKGDRLVADFRVSWNPEVPMDDAVYLLDLGEPVVDAAKNITYLFSSRSSWLPKAHVHPFFSPDGKTLLFNSDESGQTQAYLVRHLPPRKT